MCIKLCFRYFLSFRLETARVFLASVQLSFLTWQLDGVGSATVVRWPAVAMYENTHCLERNAAATRKPTFKTRSRLQIYTR
jgi:hypothetical protein